MLDLPHHVHVGLVPVFSSLFARFHACSLRVTDTVEFIAVFFFVSNLNYHSDFVLKPKLCFIGSKRLAEILF